MKRLSIILIALALGACVSTAPRESEQIRTLTADNFALKVASNRQAIDDYTNYVDARFDAVEASQLAIVDKMSAIFQRVEEHLNALYGRSHDPKGGGHTPSPLLGQ